MKNIEYRQSSGLELFALAKDKGSSPNTKMVAVPLRLEHAWYTYLTCKTLIHITTQDDLEPPVKSSWGEGEHNAMPVLSTLSEQAHTSTLDLPV